MVHLLNEHCSARNRRRARVNWYIRLLIGDLFSRNASDQV